jgi:methionine-rich copper-binding protein CopC
MHRLIHFAFTAVVAGLAFASQAAWAHASLLDATPAAGAQLDTPPKEVVLHFSEKLEGAFSSVKVTDSTNQEVSTAKALLDAKDATVMKLDLPVLQKASYSVHWSAMTYDGHRKKGNYTFAVK